MKNEKPKKRARESSLAETSGGEKQLLALLGEEKERMRLTVEATGLGTWDYDLTIGELSWSERCKAVFGLPADAEITYDIFLSRLHPDDREPLNEIVRRSLDPAGSGEYDTEYRAVCDDGTVRWIAAKGRAFFDGEGSSRRAVRFIGTVLDITERKGVEEILRESESRFRNLADNAPVMVWVTDATGYCSYLSKSWYEFTGQTEAEALGFGWVAATHPDDQAMAHDAFVKATAKQAPFRVEYRLKNRAGEYRWAIDAAAPRFGSDGEYLGFVGSVIDITESKEADARIRSSEERLRSIFNGQFQFMAILSPEGVVQDINDLALRGTGVTRDQIVGKIFWETFWWEKLPEMQANWRARLDEAARTGAPVLTVDSYQVGNEVRTADASVTAVKNAGGRVEFFIVQASDITERRRAEEALRRNENRLRRLQEITSDASRNFDEKVEALLELARTELAMPIGLLARVERDRFEVVKSVAPPEALPPDFVCSLDETFCKATLVQDEPLAVEHAGETDLRFTPAYLRFKTESYIGANVRIDGEKWGTLCVASDEPREEKFTPADKDFLRLMAQWVGGELARQQIESARIEGERRLRALTDAMPQLVWETDGEGNHLYYNQQWYDFTGLSVEESMGFGFALALHPDDKERTIKNWERAWRHGEEYKIEYRFYSRPQGIYRWFLGRATPARDASGKIVRWVGTCTDIDEQRQMAAQLERMNAERAAMLEEVSTPVVPVLPGVLALPLIGSLDTDRMRRATESALAEVTRTGAHTCIIDITGARIIDSFAVANLANLVGALRLIGAEAIVTGVSAQAAQSLVGLGLDFAQVRTQRTLAQALSSVANGNNKQRNNHQGTGLTVNGTTSNTR